MLTDEELTRIYKKANGEDVGKAQPLTTQRIFTAMRAIEAEATAPLLARIAELTEALKMALPFLESEAVIQGYGFYRPANPNNFWPDPESCSEEEIANHKAACEAFDAGNYRDDYGDGWITPSMHITRAPWGIGSYTDEIPELKARVDFCRAAMKEQP
jgi:hypothetical protein